MVIAKGNRPRKNEAAQPEICRICGGQMAMLPDLDLNGLEARCLMCGRSANEPARVPPPPFWSDDVYRIFEDDRKDEPEITISSRAASFLRKLLRERNALPGEAFRLKKEGAAAHVEISRGKPGDIKLRSRRRVVLFVSEIAAADLDGAHISLVERNGGKNIALMMPGESPRSRSLAAKRRSA